VTDFETYVIAGAFALGLPIGIGGLILGLCLHKEVERDVKTNMSICSVVFGVLATIAAIIAASQHQQSIITFSSCAAVFQCSIFVFFLAQGLWIRNYKYS